MIAAPARPGCTQFSAVKRFERAADILLIMKTILALLLFVVAGFNLSAQDNPPATPQIKVLAPLPVDGKPEAPVATLRPLLRWQAVTNAVSYRVGYMAANAKNKKATVRKHRKVDSLKAPEWKFDENVVPGAKYYWTVQAFDAEKRVIAEYGVASFFTK